MGGFISSANVVPIPGTERVSSDIAMGKVKKADFTNYGLTVLELEDIALYARSPMSILSKLVLTGNRLSNGDVGALAVFVRNSLTLDKLDLSRNDIGDTGATS